MPLQPEDFVPMHPTLKARVLEAARKDREDTATFEAEARAMVLCPPDCGERHARFPGEHCHTFLDMWRAHKALDYGYRCRQAAEARDDAANLDVGPHLKRAGVLDVHRHGMAALDGERAAVRAMRVWLGQPFDPVLRAMAHPWLVLTGPTRSGKTQAAAAVLEHFIRRYPWNSRAGGGTESALRPFVQMHAGDFVLLARQARAFSMMGSTNTQVEEACRARVLVLDDVGAERLEPDGLELFQRLFNERYAARRVTVWTSNLTPTELEARLDGSGAEPGQVGRLWRRVRDAAAVVELAAKGSRMVMGGRTTDFPRFGGEKAVRR